MSCTCVLTHLVTEGAAGAISCMQVQPTSTSPGSCPEVSPWAPWRSGFEGDPLPRVARTAQLPGTWDLQHQIWVTVGKRGQLAPFYSVLCTQVHASKCRELAPLSCGERELWTALPSSGVLYTPPPRALSSSEPLPTADR